MEIGLAGADRRPIEGGSGKLGNGRGTSAAGAKHPAGPPILNLKRW